MEAESDGLNIFAQINKDRFRSEPISEFVYICKIDQSHYVI